MPRKRLSGSRKSAPVLIKSTSSTHVLSQGGEKRHAKKTKKTKKVHKADDTKKKKVPQAIVDMAVRDPPPPTGNARPLDTALLAYLGTILPGRNAVASARQVLHEASDVLSRLGMKALLFGSWRTGTRIPSSDMDIVAVSQDGAVVSNVGCGPGMNVQTSTRSVVRSAVCHMFQELEDPMMSKRDLQRTCSRSLRSVANYLRSSRKFYNVLAITRARVPIVKAVHYEGMKVDFSFLSDGILTSQFLCEEFKKPLFSLARGLVIMVKALVAKWSLDDPSAGGLGSFPISLMVLWFLHSEVAERYPPDDRESYAACLVGFLKYYGREFNYKCTSIDYVNKRIINKPISSELCIQNPLHPHLNCAGAASKFAGHVVPKFCETYERLSKHLEYTANVTNVNTVVAAVFGCSIGDINGSGAVRRQEEFGPGASFQHLWEDETSFYIGNPIVR